MKKLLSRFVMWLIQPAVEKVVAKILDDRKYMHQANFENRVRSALTRYIPNGWNQGDEHLSRLRFWRTIHEGLQSAQVLSGSHAQYAPETQTPIQHVQETHLEQQS